MTAVDVNEKLAQFLRESQTWERQHTIGNIDKFCKLTY
jgi:hypothetical protein